MRAKLKEQGCLRLDETRALGAFLETSPARCFFLFDGLNEDAAALTATQWLMIDCWMADCPRTW